MSDKPAYLMEPSEHGPHAQWRAADGQQMNVFHHPGYERLADSHVTWSTDTATGSQDFD